MSPLKVLADSARDFGSYAIEDRRYFGSAALVIIALALIDALLLPQPHSFASLVLGIVEQLVFFSIVLRCYTWIMRKPFSFSATLRSVGSYIGPAIGIIICIFLFYLLVPMIVVLSATSIVADKEVQALLRSEIVGCYSILISFATMYSLPLLVLERRTAFSNVFGAMRLSLRELKLTCILVLPGGVLTLLVWTGMLREPNRTYVQIFNQILGRAILLLAFFVCYSISAREAAARAYPDSTGSHAVPRYAGFWRRVLAFLIDGHVIILLAAILGVCLVALLLLILFAIDAVFGTAAADSVLTSDLGYYVGFIIPLPTLWLYCTLLESSKMQATLGKLALRIVVTDVSLYRIGFGRANVRFFARILSIIWTLGIGYLIAAFTKKKQAVHDLIADTLVIRKEYPQGALAPNNSCKSTP